MSSVANRMQVPKFRAAYIKVWEDMLIVRPDLELTQRSALDEDFQRRLYAHLEMYGTTRCDLEHVTFRAVAAELGILNTPGGWENFFAAKRTGSLI